MRLSEDVLHRMLEHILRMGCKRSKAGITEDIGAGTPRSTTDSKDMGITSRVFAARKEGDDR